MLTKWKTIRGFPDYQISTLGQVRSKERTIVRGANIQQRIKSRVLSIGGKTYSIVTLQKNKKPHTRYVHRLVAEAFLPNPSNLPEINHKNLNKRDNSATNLEWISHSGNKKHAVANGVNFNPNPLRGEYCGASILTWEVVDEIRKLYSTGKYPQRKLAKRFGVTQCSIWNIVNNKTWRR